MMKTSEETQTFREAIVGAEDPERFARAYFHYLAYLMDRIDTGAIRRFVSLLEEARENGDTCFFIGNGGSAATASHMANDWNTITLKDRSGKPLRALSLVDNIPALTANANDYGYENIFVEQLKTHYRPGDKLVVISASGDSSNLIEAVRWFKKSGGTVVGLLGFDGGRLKGMCDLIIHVETEKGEYGPVEDIHMVLDHLIYSWYRRSA